MGLRRHCVAVLALALNAFATDDDAGCSASAKSCSECTSATSSCGWCEGNLYINNQPTTSHCIDPTKNAWSCDGTFKASAECDCESGGAPADLKSLGVMRGFRIDNGAADEVQLDISDGGGVGFINSDGRSNGTVASIVDCPRSDKCTGDQVFFNFDKSSASGSLSCTYRVDWQAGSNAHTVAMGCNSGGGEAPECFDDGAQLYVLYACLDQDHCPFTLGSSADEVRHQAAQAAQAQAQAAAAVAATVASPAAAAAGACSAGACGDCTADAACGWCVGTLFDTNSGVGRSGAQCFPLGPANSCQGTTLTDSCDVYKCPWYEYFLQDPATVGDCSALTCSQTTGDDPDFVRTDTPAAAYSTAQACAGNCVDPTVACLNGTCARSTTCDASSNCGECSDYHLPTHLVGVEIDATYTAGVWVFNMNANYSHVQWTSPGKEGGVTTTAAIKNWAYNGAANEYSGEFVVAEAGGSSQVRAARMQFGSGALGTNAYLALSYDATPISWGQGVAHAYNGTEFALFACNYQNDVAVSGLSDPITCTA